MQQYIETGRILTTHGVRGEVKLEPWADSPSVLTGLSALYLSDGRRLTVTASRSAGAFVLCKFEGYDTPETAAVLRGKTVYLDRTDIPLPEGGYFLCDTIGLAVLDADTGAKYGEVIGSTHNGAQLLFEVRTPTGTRYLPNVPAFVTKVDVDGGAVYVHVIPGLFDEPEEIRGGENEA